MPIINPKAFTEEERKQFQLLLYKLAYTDDTTLSYLNHAVYSHPGLTTKEIDRVQANMKKVLGL